MAERAAFGPTDLGPTDLAEEILAGRVGPIVVVPGPMFHAVARLPVGTTDEEANAYGEALDHWCREGGALVVGPKVLTLLVRDGDAWREV